MARAPKREDSATLIARDQMEAAALGAAVGAGWKAPLIRAQMLADKQQAFSDPGGKSPGPSIKCPDIYEALKKKGYSKEKAARISNSKCNE